MKFLFDENIPLRLCSILREKGYAVIGVAELGMAGAPDPQVWEVASREDRVLVTLDADFAHLLRFPPAGTPGVVRLKVHPAVDALILQQLETTLPVLLSYSLAGCLVVAEGSHIRIRRG